VQTPPEVATAMLKAAEVKPGDLVYDLGCGDGRIVIAAAREFGARGVGVDLYREHIAEAQRKAHDAGVADRVEFRLRQKGSSGGGGEYNRLCPEGENGNPG
jgi:cyclopropane fatty-acyl-phospholipid synthase-like methyltransferase